MTGRCHHYYLCQYPDISGEKVPVLSCQYLIPQVMSWKGIGQPKILFLVLQHLLWYISKLKSSTQSLDTELTISQPVGFIFLTISLPVWYSCSPKIQLEISQAKSRGLTYSVKYLSYYWTW